MFEAKLGLDSVETMDSSKDRKLQMIRVAEGTLGQGLTEVMRAGGADSVGLGLSLRTGGIPVPGLKFTADRARDGFITWDSFGSSETTRRPNQSATTLRVGPKWDTGGPDKLRTRLRGVLLEIARTGVADKQAIKQENLPNDDGTKSDTELVRAAMHAVLATARRSR